ncbi:DUF2243 domain-containing protein, partial [Xanthomonas citri pv. citri]
LVTFIGVILLWKLLHRKDINRSGYLLAGGLLTGWGLFNLIEGIIDHQILGLHNVREIIEDPQLWNFGFLAFAIMLLVAGYFIIQKGIRISRLLQ